MDEFERLLAPNRAALERFVRYRVPGRADADDVIQETLIAAYRAFDSLRDPASFKPWLMSIARNKARDWFRNRARELALPLDALVCVGDLAQHIADAAERAGMDARRIVRAGSIAEVLGELDVRVQPGDAVLVKASHFMGLSRVVEGLVN